MPDYISDTEYAASELFAVIYREHRTVADYRQRRDNIQGYVDLMQNRFLAADFDDEGIPGGVQQAYIDFMKARNKAGPDVAKYQEEIKALEASIQTKSAVSLPALAGTVLQIAKQGISVVRGSLQACPNGRSVGTQNLKTVIWQGRNQALHYDDESPHRPLSQCFQQLHHDFGPQFDLNARRGENLALDVIKILDWNDYAAFKQDLQSLLV